METVFNGKDKYNTCNEYDFTWTGRFTAGQWEGKNHHGEPVTGTWLPGGELKFTSRPGVYISVTYTAKAVAGNPLQFEGTYRDTFGEQGTFTVTANNDGG